MPKRPLFSFLRGNYSSYSNAYYQGKSNADANCAMFNNNYVANYGYTPKAADNPAPQLPQAALSSGLTDSSISKFDGQVVLGEFKDASGYTCLKLADGHVYQKTAQGYVSLGNIGVPLTKNPNVVADVSPKPSNAKNPDVIPKDSTAGAPLLPAVPAKNPEPEAKLSSNIPSQPLEGNGSYVKDDIYTKINFKAAQNKDSNHFTGDFGVDVFDSKTYGPTYLQRHNKHVEQTASNTGTNNIYLSDAWNPNLPLSSEFTVVQKGAYGDDKVPTNKLEVQSLTNVKVQQVSAGKQSDKDVSQSDTNQTLLADVGKADVNQYGSWNEIKMIKPYNNNHSERTLKFEQVGTSPKAFFVPGNSHAVNDVIIDDNAPMPTAITGTQKGAANRFLCNSGWHTVGAENVNLTQIGAHNIASGNVWAGSNITQQSNLTDKAPEFFVQNGTYGESAGKQTTYKAVGTGAKLDYDVNERFVVDLTELHKGSGKVNAGGFGNEIKINDANQDGLVLRGGSYGKLTFSGQQSDYTFRRGAEVGTYTVTNNNDAGSKGITFSGFERFEFAGVGKKETDLIAEAPTIERDTEMASAPIRQEFEEA